MRRAISSLLLLLVLLNVSACQESAETLSGRFTNPNGSSSPRLELEVALTHSQRRVGLMYRKKMEETYGMLFVFPDSEPRNFWMKNTYISLDIIYLGPELRVDSVVHNATPLSTKRRASEGPAKYVVEVRSGLAKKWGIKKGSVLKTETEIPAPY